MKAAVIESPERSPRFADFAEPVVADGETLIEVTAVGLHPIVRMLASGEHYGSQGTLPMIPGIDGTGRSGGPSSGPDHEPALWRAERPHLNGAHLDQNSAGDHPDRRDCARSS